MTMARCAGVNGFSTSSGASTSSLHTGTHWIDRHRAAHAAAWHDVALPVTTTHVRCGCDDTQLAAVCIAKSAVECKRASTSPSGVGTSLRVHDDPTGDSMTAYGAFTSALFSLGVNAMAPPVTSAPGHTGHGASSFRLASSLSSAALYATCSSSSLKASSASSRISAAVASAAAASASAALDGRWIPSSAFLRFSRFSRLASSASRAFSARLRFALTVPDLWIALRCSTKFLAKHSWPQKKPPSSSAAWHSGHWNSPAGFPQPAHDGSAMSRQ
mmetsp:Transcript_26627/g.82359  ORF Transcript_26627/g.82359 Transcript_26627/m.82359 type:complete len:273 (-) Transcript_26627:36-854(-)